ncbi:MAG: S8 family serine peptidase, partial [bacterium]
MKKVLTLVLVLGLVFSLGMPVKASNAQEAKSNTAAPAVSNFPNLTVEEKVSHDLLNAQAYSNLNYLVYLWDQVNVDQVAQEAQAKAIVRGTPKGDLKLVGRTAVYHALKEKAQYTQAPLIELLQKKGLSFESFWITNCLAVTSDKATLLELASRPEVRRIEPVRVRQILGTIEPSSDNHINAVEWSVAMVGAPQVWSLGFTGQNVVVSNVDTGVDWTHPALQRKWRAYDPSNPSVPNPSLLPYSWFDAVNNNNTAPYDDYGHGTHTMGTMVGSDPDNINQIGVAPGAIWIATKGFNSAGQGTDTDLLECAQWILAPNNNPAMAPDVCSNSWGGGPGLDEWYRPSVQAWKAAGIVPVFAAGNDGPGAGTVVAPGNYPETMCMAAIDQNKALASFSSRGPSPYPAPYDLKPDLSAPGVAVRSSLPGGSYGYGSGTSMATPHGAGAAALLLSIEPTLTPTDVIELLKGTAEPLTDSTYPASPNYGYGYGLVNAYNAALQLV